MSELRDSDWAAIADLAAGQGLESACLRRKDAEIVVQVEENRLKFNAPTPVLYLVLRTEGWQLELFYWCAEDEWELVHASRLA